MVPERRSVLASLAGLCSLGLAGCNATEDGPETDPETTISPDRSTSESTAGTTSEAAPGTPTATLTPGGTETPTTTETPTETWMPTASQLTARGTGSRYFGGAVGISEDTAVVGAQGTASDLDGVAYVFERLNGSWSQQTTLAPDALDTFDADFPVAVSDDTILVGHYLYTRTDGSWTLETTLTPDEGSDLDVVEISAGIDGDTAVVGNPEHRRNHGGAFVFRRSDGGWSHQTTLVPGDERTAGFGDAVSVDGDTIIVGSYADDTPNATNAGSAYVFTRSEGTWSQQARLTLDDARDDDWFGSAVSLSGDTAIVGAARDVDPNDEHSGTAYVFDRTDGEWHRQARLDPTYGERDDWFGQYGGAVAIAGDTALLSGLWSPTPQIPDGVESAYLFSRADGSWSRTQIIRPPESGGLLGPVALRDDTALVGSPMGRDEQGIAYVYRI